MSFPHLPITSHDDGAEGGGLVGCSTEQRCSRSQKFTLTVSCDLKRGHNKSAKPKPYGGTDGVHLCYTLYSLTHSQTFVECQAPVWHCPRLCLPGVPKWYTWGSAVWPLTAHPVWFLISWKTITYALAKWKREHLAQTHSPVVKLLWFIKYLDKNANMYCTKDALKRDFNLWWVKNQ